MTTIHWKTGSSHVLGDKSPPILTTHMSSPNAMHVMLALTVFGSSPAKKHMRTTESPFPEADKRTIHSRIYKWDIWVQELTNQEDSFTEARSCMFYVRFTRSQEQHSFLKYVFWRFILRSVLLRCLCIMLVCICA